MERKIMARAVTKDRSMEKRSESRGSPKVFHGASIKLVGVPLYQFKLKDTSENGASILVKADSLLNQWLITHALLGVFCIHGRTVSLGQGKHHAV